MKVTPVISALALLEKGIGRGASSDVYLLKNKRQPEKSNLLGVNTMVTWVLSHFYGRTADLLFVNQFSETAKSLPLCKTVLCTHVYTLSRLTLIAIEGLDK